VPWCATNIISRDVIVHPRVLRRPPPRALRRAADLVDGDEDAEEGKQCREGDGGGVLEHAAVAAVAAGTDVPPAAVRT
jgi:hypothetical protein